MRPGYQEDVCERLRRAVDCLRAEGFDPFPATVRRLDEDRLRLVHAALAIHVLTPQEFAADFRAQFCDVMARVTSKDVSIEDVIARLPDAEVTELHAKIVELYEETCDAKKTRY